eukprot:CAMPEP_0118858978 /NCGR_PEP_ID=MMETSP1163-20130328/5422_1 /TAXON_ID=124430 /ORGANISM="Phaeomonas parva, Strain CCMP2877" /LENGTH=52 /DNA_ID=CAMNT_0006792501 /DNA_START=308 /DNA_END=466 /DNA_ORIENTATION=-
MRSRPPHRLRLRPQLLRRFAMVILTGSSISTCVDCPCAAATWRWGGLAKDRV